jgi:hypothetical protein
MAFPAIKQAPCQGDAAGFPTREWRPFVSERNLVFTGGTGFLENFTTRASGTFFE